MLAEKSAPEHRITDHCTQKRTLGPLDFGASCRSGSPKTHELLSRQAIAQNKDCKGPGCRINEG